MAFGEEISKRARDLDGDGEPDKGSEYIIWAGGAIFLILALFWISFWFSSLLHGFDPLPTRAIAQLPSGVIGLFQSPGNPSNGWGEYSSLIAPAWMFWPIALAVLFVGFRTARFVWRKVEKWRTPDRGGAKWAEDEDLGEIIDPKNTLINRLIMRKTGGPTGVVLGATQDSGRILRLQTQNHALVVAGTRSGKTAGLCTPALLTYNGAVIATSVKDDLVKDTIRERRKMGKVFVFDPTRVLAAPEDPEERERREAKGEVFVDDEQISYWSPLDNAKDWREALRIAEVLIDVTLSKGGESGGNMQFFKNMSAKVLPVFLYAAAVMDEDMRRVLKWLNRINDKQTHAEVDSILRWKDNIDALDIWLGFVGRDNKLRGDIGATIESALVSYQDPKVQDTAMTNTCPEDQHIRPEALFNGENNTLYIVAPMSEQNRLEPIFVAMIQGLLTYVSDLPYNLKTPCIAVLDEAANIAALPQLPNFLSAIGSKGVSIITAWQDFSQIESRYGKQKDTILNNSRGKLILPGITDPTTLQYFSSITGEAIEDSVSISRAEKNATSRNLSINEQRRILLDAVTLREQKFGEGILVYGNLPPTRIKLKMFFLDNELRAKAGIPLIPRWKILLRKLPGMEHMIKV
jgi:type IV secretory pathway TraG/TraD family ATPase VirD4